ncbi:MULTISPECIES: 5-(carboxyamino)imidazole ribonucleotide synthase [Sorangium]|uniref:N5-carboxyaminoimidazole ribonucleotide synthase n=1 Tax=Sorangium cellulosum TaxID=56 RepID=A0A4P2QJQ6_SORCE|nr:MULTISPECIES: 5-(carboxyamino)imidazole ribonucleotide synthase [Sorangium]AUX30229.1 phosphoribosylaminoimidazole carboxylase [Sorangium cellulosum]WCQ89622.1 N5-carboxyaminoimidazole ribonucleotide synthase [Sorangium sp. Soce836]
MPIAPGSTLGILGGGQLGRMTALAARTLGYKVHALDPDPDCPARSVLDRCIVASFDDAAQAAELASQCDVVTLEIEKVATAGLAAAARLAPVRPSADVLAMVQDRGVQKSWLSNNGFPVGPFREVATSAELLGATRAMGGACFVKSCVGGYDGRGQLRLSGGAPPGGGDVDREVEALFGSLGGQRCVVEQALDLEAELSVLVARSPSGKLAVYPPALNHHRDQILDWSLLPGPLSASVTGQAVQIALDLAVGLRVEGLLVVELFLLKDGRLLINELAPRPHNSYHASEVACATSQFEQAVRAVCDLPLGSVEIVRPAAIVNLLGDAWLGGAPPPFEAALEIPGVRLHLYGKRIARPGRKMGHLSATGSTPEEALVAAKLAMARLSAHAGLPLPSR